VTVLAERLLGEREAYESLLRQGVPEFFGMTITHEYFGDPYFDFKLHCDLGAEYQGEEKLTALRGRKAGDRHWNEVTKTAWNAPVRGSRPRGELWTGHDKLYLYYWQLGGEVAECLFVDMEKMRAMIILGLLEPDSRNIPGGHNRKQTGWGWDINRLQGLGLILGRWLAAHAA